MAQEIAKTAVTYSTPALPGRVITDIVDWAMSAAERDSTGKLYLRNVPNAADKRTLVERVNVVMAALKQHDQREIAILVMDMLASYDVAMSRQITARERKEAAVIYVRELKGVPTCAVQQACQKIRLGIAPDISHQFKPTPIQVRVLAVNIASPWKQEARQIGEILNATLYIEGVSGEERERVGIKMRTLADELKEGAYREGIIAELSEAEKQLAQKVLARHAENADKMIAAEYARLGRGPIKAGSVVLSPALVKQIEAREKALAKSPPQEPMEPL
jgi:predicted nucleic acid-binding Zn ribbon protein